MKKAIFTLSLLFVTVFCFATNETANSVTTVTDHASWEMEQNLQEQIKIFRSTNEATDDFEDCVMEFDGYVNGVRVKMKVTIRGVSCAQLIKALAAL